MSIHFNDSEATGRIAALNRQATQIKGKDWGAAVECLQEANRLMRENWAAYPIESWTRLPLFLQQAGRFDEAIEAFDVILGELEPKLDEAYAHCSDLERSHIYHCALEHVYDKMRLCYQRENRPVEAETLAEMTAKVRAERERVAALVDRERQRKARRTNKTTPIYSADDGNFSLPADPSPIADPPPIFKSRQEAIETLVGASALAALAALAYFNWPSSDPAPPPQPPPISQSQEAQPSADPPQPPAHSEPPPAGPDGNATALIPLGGFPAAWFLVARFYRRRGHGRLLSHLTGVAAGALAFVLLVIAFVPAADAPKPNMPAAPNTADTPTNANPAPTAKPTLTPSSSLPSLTPKSKRQKTGADAQIETRLDSFPTSS